VVQDFATIHSSITSFDDDDDVDDVDVDDVDDVDDIFSYGHITMLVTTNQQGFNSIQYNHWDLLPGKVSGS